MLTLSKCKPLSFRFPISMKCWTFIHGSITENIILIWWQYNSAYQAWRGTWILLQSCKTADFNLAVLGCCGLECMCPSKILRWKLIPKVMVLGVGILGGSGLKQWCEQITNDYIRVFTMRPLCSQEGCVLAQAGVGQMWGVQEKDRGPTSVFLISKHLIPIDQLEEASSSANHLWH